MTQFQPADNLRSRTFIGLLIAQFLAAFNDQAIHASAMFFAINQNTLNETEAISLMPILFYAPWALFSTVAGFLADKYSKQYSLIAWKWVEVVITLIALAGFWLGDQGNRAGPWIVLSTVFLMGMHSAFFVPAKYGVMPEILQSHMLSRGNGLLESFSFLAIILGTVCGGVLSYLYHGRETLIGVVLVSLALIGAIASLLIQHMPAANPKRSFPPFVFGPLFNNMKQLLRSRPLAFAVIGIAFFTFIVSFMRATVYMHGESQIERWSELKTSVVVGMVALGIGLGSPLVGFLSGGKIELGLIPIGALGMILTTVLAALVMNWIPGLIGCIIGIGFFTGFYIVPLFTLLQHRAPAVSKGDSIATSNLINVTGAILASLVFFGIDGAARHIGLTPTFSQEDWFTGTLGADPEYVDGRPYKMILDGVNLEATDPETLDQQIVETDDDDAIDPFKEQFRKVIEVVDDDTIDPFKERLRSGDRVTVSRYRRGRMTHFRIRREGAPMKPVYDKHLLPRFLFLSAGGMTLFTLILLWWQLPSLFGRMRLWFHWRGKVNLEVFDMHQLPDRGPVLLVSGSADPETCSQIYSATDRTAVVVLPQDGKADMDLALHTLHAGDVVIMALHSSAWESEPLYTYLTRQVSCPVVPVYTEKQLSRPGETVHRVYIMVGEPLAAHSSAQEVQDAIQLLAADFHQKRTQGHRDEQKHGYPRQE